MSPDQGQRIVREIHNVKIFESDTLRDVDDHHSIAVEQTRYISVPWRVRRLRWSHH